MKLPDDVGVLMANLAEVWGWTPDKTAKLSLADLIYWHDEMLARRPKNRT